MALLLEEFQRIFSGQRYRHRSSTQGDQLACMFYEDLYLLGHSRVLEERVEKRECVVSTTNRVTGRARNRRGDGTFGEALPNSTPSREASCNVAVGPTANLQIGVEVKILATAMIKQIDRVINDLRNQAAQFRSNNPSAIAVSIVGVNHAQSYTSYEGERSYVAGGSRAPAAEAPRVIQRLDEARQDYDELLVLRFGARNSEPFPFAWNDLSSTRQELDAALLRTLRLYEARFS